MGERRAREDRRRAREFEVFVAGAAGRLLHAATLLTGEPSGSAPAAQELLVAALSRTYADWDRLRGEDPYEHTRQEIALRFAHTARRYRRPRGGMLAGLPPRERLMLVLRLYEGVAEEQVAASLGLPVERVRTLCTRAMAQVLSGGAGSVTVGDADGDPDADRSQVAEADAAGGVVSLVVSRMTAGLRHRGAGAGDRAGRGPEEAA
ncbi:sigma-70-like protein [Streptomyces sp. Amel2xB2]|uniref:sigma factor-like helix-turn-helix DNA-binding protein n=1 Tax=Streptomyces sp. Amel2xB2 TaxID=1305829 RepID=UPI000DB9ACE0|nr:sigma-70-like protein [Streptomyces sp. Amel2xB2]